jgi:hypothetical protein
LICDVSPGNTSVYYPPLQECLFGYLAIVSAEPSVRHESLVLPPSEKSQQRRQMALNEKSALCDHRYSREEILAKGIGLVLRSIRQQWKLSLREVEVRSLCFAQEKGNQSY